MATWNSSNTSFFSGNETLHETVILATNEGSPLLVNNHINHPVIRVDDDTVQHTSRNRRKVSDQSILYFNNIQFDEDERSFDVSSTNAHGNAVFSTYDGMIALQVSNTASANIARQSRAVIPYYPGRQNEVLLSLRLTTPQEGIRRRLGLFDENNGAYFEDDGGTYAVVLRRNTESGPVETRVTRDNWNVDKLDGTGPSRITANAEAVQMMTIEYEHFGAGQVEFNWVFDNNKFPIHQFNTGNYSNTIWALTPFLPIRQELTNKTGVAGDHKLFIGSTAIATEGTIGVVGRMNSAATRIQGYSLGSTANIFKPVLVIRLRSDRLSGVVMPEYFQAGTLDNTNIFYEIIENANVTAAGVWQSINNESFVEYNSNTSTTFSGGDVIMQGYISGTGQGGVIQFPRDAINILKRKNMGTESENLVVAIASGANKSAYASLSWVELR